MSARTVDVVIPTHDTRDVTLRCLRALEDESKSKEIVVRCILVDNASCDGTADAVGELLPDVLVVRNARNAGYGEAANQGTRLGVGDYVLILNSDAIARPGAVATLAQYLDQHPRVVAAGGQLVGGFEEGFFYWFEDVDLVRRLRERGRIGYVREAVFEHLGATTFRQWSRPEVIVARYQGLQSTSASTTLGARCSCFAQ